jgi:diguanylate cyclase (GGDEF)-like protein
VSALYLAVSLAAGPTAFVAWRRRRRTGAARAVAATALASGLWSLGDLVGIQTTSLTVWRFGGMLTIFGVCLSVGGFFVQSRMIAQPRWRPSWTLLGLLSLEPIAILTRVYVHTQVAGSHRAPRAGELAGHFVSVPDLPFWLHLAYSYAVFSAALAILTRAWVRAPGLFRTQMGTILVAAVLPFAVNVLALVLGRGYPAADVTPLGQLLSTVLTLYGLTRQGLLTIVPVARSMVLEHVAEAVVVTDPDGTVIDINPAARSLLGHPGDDPSQYIGRPLKSLLDWPQDSSGTTSGIQSVMVGGRTLFCDVRMSDLVDDAGRLVARVLVARDVTVTHEQQEELQRSNQKLRQQIRIIEALRHDLAEQAARDGLTGVFNRRQLMANLDRDLVRARVGEYPLSVLMIDIDHFKWINDTHGHPTGDVVIQSLARNLSASARVGDTVARYGGEEFMVVLPGADTEEAVRRAEGIRRSSQALETVSTDGRAVAFTVSIGVATERHGFSVDSLLRDADRALYEAKRAGRNRTGYPLPWNPSSEPESRS